MKLRISKAAILPKSSAERNPPKAGRMDGRRRMKRLFFLWMLCALFATPVVAHAATSCNPGGILPSCVCHTTNPTSPPDCQLKDFVQLFINLYGFGVHIAAPLAIFFIIVGSIILVTAAGYSNRIDLGKTMITQAVTGLIIVLISWVIVDTAILLITQNPSRTVFGQKWFGGFTYPCDKNNLYEGCLGGNVKDLQKNLSALGYTVSPDGSYGSDTQTAVQDFQWDFDSVTVEKATAACDGSQDAITVWDAIFFPQCPEPEIPTCCLPWSPEQSGTICTVTLDDAAAKQLTVSGTVDQATQDALSLLSNGGTLSQSFISACEIND